MATAPIFVDEIDAANEDGPPLIVALAQSQGDISDMLDTSMLATIGADVVRDYERDLADRKDWEDDAREGLKQAAQEKREAKNYPFNRASNVDYPLLAIASMQFNARAYPAICKTGNIVRCKVIGSDKGRPQTIQTPQGRIPLVRFEGQVVPLPLAQQALAQAQANMPPPVEGQPAPQLPQAEPLWDIRPGAKTARADRVSSYMNVYVEYRMDDWEEDTDQMLTELPIVGCGFRKLWWSDGKQCAAYVSALDLVVPVGAKSLDTTPRTTERMPDVFPYQIRQRMASGEYRAIELGPVSGESEERKGSSEDDPEAPRLLLEQHRYLDLDGDGADEPYIVTVDKASAQVLKIEANYGPDDVHLTNEGNVKRINRNRFYVKYSFLPNPKGSFYNIGFAHLLSQIRPIINTCLNLTIDAAHAAVAGGGFIASGLRLQGNGQTNTLRWQPGEYKTVNVTGADLRQGIVERTFPAPSPILFQIFELMLGAAKDITSVKDVVTGDAPNNAPVGTTLALIEQGLQVFTAIYKRIYRALGEEYRIIYDNLGTYGGDEIAEDYLNVLDDLDADFVKDFSDGDMDIKPVADPTTVTNMQKIAKAQVVMQIAQGNPLVNPVEALRRVLESAEIEDIDSLIVQPSAEPDPAQLVQLHKEASIADLNQARARAADASVLEVGFKMGQAAGESGA